ncbi:hypothetical protein B0T10DRAFT_591157 [Thelonectria olida]|uniref:ABM domain-containing protein n=1 Tax=Thelonectria olida TaxID=1576542 RepID=A0A9P9AIR8_9HYPO|nr:hypothetical protein B0T10DRAFT_591157 [Thelonectria olida]
MATPAENRPYFSVSTIAVKADKIDEAFASFQEIAEETAKEPGAKVYRFYKVEGKNEFVWIEKFESREAYTAHVQSSHVQAWAKKYMGSDLFDGTFEFHPLSESGPGAGGFERN